MHSDRELRQTKNAVTAAVVLHCRNFHFSTDLIIDTEQSLPTRTTDSRERVAEVHSRVGEAVTYTKIASVFYDLDSRRTVIGFLQREEYVSKLLLSIY